MKAASAATLALLSAGQYAKAELWQFDLVYPVAATLRFTNWDVPLTVGGYTWGTGLVLTRASITQANTLEVQKCDLTISPQWDNPTTLTVAGLGIIAAFQKGYFDNAIVTMYKVFMATPGDVSAGATYWYNGQISDVQATRSVITASVSTLPILLNVSMPRNVLQTGCLHTLFDPGCVLAKSAYQSAGTVTGSGATITLFTASGLAQASGYFDLGTLTFTSGANAGLSRSVKQYLVSQSIQLASPLSAAPAAGDTFFIYPGCDKQQATCSAKFNNLVHFRGYPYIPVPETLYDGGTYNPQVISDGGTGSTIVGSSTNANRFKGSYQP